MLRFTGVLIDLGGVVFIGDELIEGSVEALQRLRSAGVSTRFLTNTTRKPLSALVGKLKRLGINASGQEIFTPAVAARQLLGNNSAYLLIHPNLREDFAGISAECPRFVVVGDAGEAFSYENLNAAFRALEDGAELLALAKNRYFKECDGPSLDAGPFVVALEYGSGRTARVIGKPSPAFFFAAVTSLGFTPDAVAMIGDDAESDVQGAIAAGIAGILVRTGKYKSGDETRIEQSPSHVAHNLSSAVDWILGS